VAKKLRLLGAAGNHLASLAGGSSTAVLVPSRYTRAVRSAIGAARSCGPEIVTATLANLLKLS